MCGIVGIVGQSNVNQSIYDALTVLQHRGQDAAGIVTCDGDRLSLRKDVGMVRDVFRTRHMRNLIGDRKSTRLNSSHVSISYAVFCLKKKKQEHSNHGGSDVIDQ